MGFWKRLLRIETKSDIATSLDLWREIYGHGRISHAGKLVNLDTTLEDDAAYACMRVISEGGSQVPWHLLQESGGRKKIATDHPLDRLLYRSPNGWQTSFEFRETIYLHLLVAGNAYVFVNRVGNERKIKELIPIEPRRVSVTQKSDYSLQYAITSNSGARQVFGNDAIWHLRGPSWNTWSGLDAVKLARNALGLSASLEQGQSEFQKNSANMSGIVSVKDKLDKTQFEQLSAWIERHQIGGDRSHAPLIIDREGKYESNRMSGVDQQLLETRRHQVESICRRFRVMPLMIGHPADMAARAATESIFLQHVVHCLMPWYQRIEQSADVNLLSEQEQQAGYYTKFNANALMRGATKDRAEYYAKALGSGGTKGWLTQNDVRDLEDMDRNDDPEADALPQATTKNPSTNPPIDPASQG
jgi:HK97 family phage portal protein